MNMENLYEFTVKSRKGIIEQSIISCKDWLEASRVKDEILRHADIESVDFDLIEDIGENVKFETSITVKLPSDKKIYPVIKVPSSGYSDWMEGARTWCFVYSRDHGNFILEGYRGEVGEYLKKNYTHYFCYISMWNQGRSRGHWYFWKDNIGIFEPSKVYKSWKYVVRPYTGGRSNVSVEDSDKKALKFKRLPKRWIPEFNKL